MEQDWQEWSRSIAHLDKKRKGEAKTLQNRGISPRDLAASEGAKAEQAGRSRPEPEGEREKRKRENSAISLNALRLSQLKKAEQESGESSSSSDGTSESSQRNPKRKSTIEAFQWLGRSSSASRKAQPGEYDSSSGESDFGSSEGDSSELPRDKTSGARSQTLSEDSISSGSEDGVEHPKGRRAISSRHKSQREEGWVRVRVRPSRSPPEWYIRTTREQRRYLILL